MVALKLMYILVRAKKTGNLFYTTLVFNKFKTEEQHNKQGKDEY